MTRRREQIVLELQKLASELRQANPRVAVTKLEQIDHLLDECVDQKGAHPAECGCWECRKAVWNVLSRRRLGEMLDPRDRASVEEWGTVG
jgi:hypothetical protein